MKVVMLSKALVSGAYQKKLEEIARLPNVTLVALVPPSWQEPHVGVLHLERRFTEGYRLETLPIVVNGHHHLYFFRGLRRVLERERPDVLHVDEESFNLATFLALRAGVAIGARCCFYNWANMSRSYPPPFCFFERYAFTHAHYAIAGNHEAALIMRRHGYSGPLAILPQFGVDPDLFAPAPNGNHRLSRDTFTIGYMGRLIEAKGVLDLVDAVAELPAHVALRLVGDGDVRPRLEKRIRALGLGKRVTIQPAVSSTDVPTLLPQLDVLVLPSRTTRSWKEQFGRILIEAMSCGVPVVGSDSGEIPNVIGDAGLVVPEQNVTALRGALLKLLDNPSLRKDLRQRGRERVFAHFTQAALARQYYEIYRALAGEARLP